MSSNCIVGLTYPSNDFDLATKNYVTSNYVDDNFKKELIKVLEELRIKRNFRKIIFYRSHN